MHKFVIVCVHACTGDQSDLPVAAFGVIALAADTVSVGEAACHLLARITDQDSTINLLSRVVADSTQGEPFAGPCACQWNVVAFSGGKLGRLAIFKEAGDGVKMWRAMQGLGTVGVSIGLVAELGWCQHWLGVSIGYAMWSKFQRNWW